MGVNHELIIELVNAMVDPEHKDSKRNGISLPDHHMDATSAPPSLLLVLQDLDPVATARTLRDELLLDGDGNPKLEEMRKKRFVAPKEIKATQTVGVLVLSAAARGRSGSSAIVTDCVLSEPSDATSFLAH